MARFDNESIETTEREEKKIRINTELRMYLDTMSTIRFMIILIGLRVCESIDRFENHLRRASSIILPESKISKYILVFISIL